MDGADTSTRIAAMAPPSGLQISSNASDYNNGRLPFSRSITAPTGFQAPPATEAHQEQQQQSRPDRSHLAPEDAFHATAPSRRLKAGFEPSGNRDLLSRHLHRKDATGSRSRSRRRKRPWKKLLWVKQSCELSWGTWRRGISERHINGKLTIAS